MKSFLEPLNLAPYRALLKEQGFEVRRPRRLWKHVSASDVDTMAASLSEALGWRDEADQRDHHIFLERAALHRLLLGGLGLSACDGRGRHRDFDPRTEATFCARGGKFEYMTQQKMVMGMDCALPPGRRVRIDRRMAYIGPILRELQINQ